ncbi:uncharacterized protein LOC143232145 isoform X1 [Tachypleus tridentatus]|uniref:uncharacterized protein LOC143232145 isoform X1 n=1 Tax=Tachypleus tridentatus TaxID=6853 RepID=UPI003FCFB7DD
MSIYAGIYQLYDDTVTSSTCTPGRICYWLKASRTCSVVRRRIPSRKCPSYLKVNNHRNNMAIGSHHETSSVCSCGSIADTFRAPSSSKILIASPYIGQFKSGSGTLVQACQMMRME